MSGRVLRRCVRVLRELASGRATRCIIGAVLGDPFIRLVAPFCRFGLVAISPSSGGFISYTVSTGTRCVIAGSRRCSILGSVSFPGIGIMGVRRFYVCLSRRGWFLDGGRSL